MKVIVQPQNGYINRIQALASSALLAQEIGAEFEVQWIPGAAAPASPVDIFSPGFLQCFVNEPKIWGLEPYLNYDPVSHVVTLAGLDQGEQAFMADLRTLLESDHSVSEIRISAGGKFALGEMDFKFAEARRDYYRSVLEFSADIEREADSQSMAHGEYLGLHLRYSDRNHQAPTRKQIVRAVKNAHDMTSGNKVFIATDTPSDLQWWQERFLRKGISTWWNSTVSLNSGESGTAASALIDWRVLGKSRGMVYFAKSSFGEEAAVAAGCEIRPIALSPSFVRSSFVSFGTHVHAATAYFKRHLSIFRG